jgi:hypothetical protein
MNKETLNSPHLFAVAKQNKFHVSLPIEDYNAMKDDDYLETFVNEQLKMIMFEDIRKTLQESESILYPRISELLTEKPKHNKNIYNIYDERITLYYTVEYFTCLIRVAEDVFKLPDNVASFSISGGPMPPKDFYGITGRSKGKTIIKDKSNLFPKEDK